MNIEPATDSARHTAEHYWGKKAANDLGAHFERHGSTIRALRNAIETDDKGGVRRLQDAMLKSYSSKLTALVRSGAKELSLEQATELAAKIDPSKDCGEVVAVFAQEKDNGDFRAISDFGCLRRALQLLCRDIIEAKFGRQATAYLEKGRGADSAADKVREFVAADLQWFLLLDIKDFFPSVQREGLVGLLGLPKEVIRNTLTISEDAPLISHSTTHSLSTLTGAVREGIPQGSGASTTIANLLLGTLLETFAPADRTLHYGDDVLIACSSREEAMTLEKALSGQLLTHPCGPFQLKRSEVRNSIRGFEFVKYAYRRDRFDGHLRVSPAGRSFTRFSKTISRLFRDLPPAVAMDKLDALAPRWLAAFPRWEHVPLSRLNLEVTITNAAFEGIVSNKGGDTLGDKKTLLRLKQFELSSDPGNPGNGTGKVH